MISTLDGVAQMVGDAPRDNSAPLHNPPMQAAPAVLLRVGLSTLRNQLLASFQWLIAVKSQDQGQPIAAEPDSAVHHREYTVYMSSNKVTTGNL